MIRAGFACVYDGRCPAMLMGDHGRRLWQASLAFNDRRRADGVRCEASENKFSAVGSDLCVVPYKRIVGFLQKNAPFREGGAPQGGGCYPDCLRHRYLP